MIPAVIGTASIPLIYLLGREMSGSRVGLIAAALLATSPLHIEYSQEARGYVLLMAASMLVIWSISKSTMIYGSEKTQYNSGAVNLRVWGAYVTGLLVALYTHNTAILLWLIANIMLLARWLWGLKAPIPFLWAWLGSNVIVLIGWSWWLPIVIDQSLYGLSDFWIMRLNAAQAVGWTESVYGQMWFPYAQPLVSLGFIAAGFTGVYFLWLRNRWFSVLGAGLVILLPLLTCAVRETLKKGPRDVCSDR